MERFLPYYRSAIHEFLASPKRFTGRRRIIHEISLGFGFFGQRNETEIYAQPGGFVQTVGRRSGENCCEIGCKIRIGSGEEYPGM